MKNLDISTSTAYFRNQFVPFNEANLSIASSPVLYGLSIYTVFSANLGEDNELYVFRLADHYKRLVNSARIMDFDDFEKQCTFKEFTKVMQQLLERNAVHEDVLVRVTIFIDELIAGTRVHGLRNSWAAYVYPMGEILPRAGVHACVSSWVRASDNAIPARAKVNGNYVNASLMKNEALQNGFDEAIALDENGHVTEGTVANIFLVRNGVLITPDCASDILEGITRNSILKIADDMGLPCRQTSVDRTELYISDELFFCGSSARITPILSVDKRPVGDGTIGPITAKLMSKFESVQRGEDKDYGDWLLKI